MTNHSTKLKGTGAEDEHLSLNLGGFRRIARIALWVSAFSLIILGIMVASVDNPTGDYRNMLSTLANSQDNLIFLIVMAGTWLISATAATTYFITLYSSFRVAGPLYRFARNLEFGHQHELRMPHIKIRSYDHFQQECKLMEESVDTLLEHYKVLAQELDQLANLVLDSDADKQAIIAKITQLKELEQRLGL